MYSLGFELKNKIRMSIACGSVVMANLNEPFTSVSI